METRGGSQNGAAPKPPSDVQRRFCEELGNRRPVETVVVLVDTECLETCTFRGATEYVSAAVGIGKDSTLTYCMYSLQ